MRSSLRLIETYNRLGNPFRFLWTFGGFDVELLSLQFEVVVCDEQVNNSLDVNTETEVEVRLLVLDEVVFVVEGIEVVLTRLLRLPESFSRFLTFLRWRRLIRFFSEDVEARKINENKSYATNQMIEEVIFDVAMGKTHNGLKF